MRQLTGSALKIAVNRFKRKGLGADPNKAIDNIRRTVTNLFREERIEGPLRRLDESRQYAERLIQLAQKYPYDKGVMEVMDFWVLEKDLIPKIYEQFLPRFKDSPQGPFTNQFRLCREYPTPAGQLPGTFQVVLEMKGNPYPPINPPQVTIQPKCARKILTNVLVQAVREEANGDRFKPFKFIEEH